MPSTIVQTFGSDPKAQKKWSSKLSVDEQTVSYFTRRFVGESSDSVIERKTELESDAGDTISFDLAVMLKGRPVTGDARVENTAENLKFFTDSVIIDQARKQVSAGGKMTRKRTSINMRKRAKDALAEYWSAWIDQLHFIYLSGSRGINQDYIEPTTFTGHAGNPIQAPDPAHLIYGGTATAYANVTTSDKMTRATIEKAAVKSRTMRQLNRDNQNMLPVTVNGEKHYVIVMSPFQEYDLRTSDTAGWYEIQKAAITAEGRRNPIFTGGLGMINNVVLHSHENVIRFSDMGVGTNVIGARAIMMGRQAGIQAYGTAGKQRFTWVEEMRDAGNEPTVTAGTIIGVKKTRYNGKDYGVIAIDTAAADPNP